jgi:ABC-type transport system involved in Fe-S cluster assembly fused permease/ATPase subunit
MVRGVRQFMTAVARAVLKRRDLLNLVKAASALGGRAQAKVSHGLRQEHYRGGITLVLHRASLARSFSRAFGSPMSLPAAPE